MPYVMPFILGMVVTMVWLPVLTRLANRWLIIDQPGVRKVHTSPIPRVGGMAMAMGVFVAALLTIRLQDADRWFLVSAAILIAFGVADDRFDLDYRVKLVGQMLAVSVVVFVGDVRIQTVVLSDRVLIPEWVSLPLTVLFLVGVTNAVNLADGLDGLAGGTTFLCLCAVALLSSFGVSGSSTALALALAGAVLGFLRFNTYPATVFMGDAGSQLLGFSIAVLGIRATQSSASEISAAIPVLLLALPILDTLSVMVQRIAEGRSPFSPDKNHIHHKLLALGFQHHEAVMLIYVLQGVLFVAAYFLRYESDLLILSIVVSFFVLAIALLQLATRSGWNLRPTRSATGPAAAPPANRDTGERGTIAGIADAVLAVALLLYSFLVICKTARLTSDFLILTLALLTVLMVYAAVLRLSALTFVEKAVLYVGVTGLVYLDSLVSPSDHLLTVLTWVVVCIAAVATAVRLRLSEDRRFQLTPLDVIVLFMALVVPSLPGTLRLPNALALALAKLVVLYYAVEMLVSRAERRMWLRIAAVGVLAALVLRPLAFA